MPRDSSGNYTLPGAYNPVVPNTTILADWANVSLSDIASSMTDSLDRSGRGGMLAALKAVDGTAAAPGYTFSSQTSLGLYRVGSNQLGVTVASTQRQVWTNTGTDITGNATVSGTFSAGAVSLASLALSGALTVDGAAALNGGTTVGNAAGDAFTINSSAVSIPNGLNFDSNTLVIDAANNRVGVNSASPVGALQIRSTGINTGLEFNTDANSGSILAFDRVAATYKTLVLRGTELVVSPNDVERLRISTAGVITPGTNNSQSLGTAALQWSDVRSVLGTFSGAVAVQNGAGSEMLNVGDGTGNKRVRISGGNTNANDGSGILFYNSTTFAGGVGNHSGILGGVYDSTIVLQAVNDIGLYVGGAVLGLSVGNTGNVSIPSGALSVTGGNFDVSRSVSGGFVQSFTQNTSNTAASDAIVTVAVAGTSAGDPYAFWSVSGGASYVLGIDNSASDAFVGSVGTVLGATNWLSVASNGAVTFPDADGVTVTGPLTASGGVTGSLTGNASTATTLQTGRTIAITGDLTYTSPSFNGSANVTAAGTLATVNANVGSFGSSTAIPNFTVNAKGLITAAGTSAVVAPAGTLSGGTLAASVTASSLTSVGTLTSLTVSGTATFNDPVNLGGASGDAVALVGTLTNRGAATTYTPTITVVSNITGTPTLIDAWYFRQNDLVDVYVAVELVPTAANTFTNLALSLPVSTTFSSVYQINGDCKRASGFSTAALSFGVINGSTINHRAECYFSSVSTATQTWFFHFSYRVL